MLMYAGDFQQFFSTLGKRGIFLFALVSLALMGPFGVLARCITVAHGAVTLLFPGLSLVWVNAFLCYVIFVLTLNKNQIVTLLGTVLTPFLLVSIVAIGGGDGSLPQPLWFRVKPGVLLHRDFLRVTKPWIFWRPFYSPNL